MTKYLFLLLITLTSLVSKAESINDQIIDIFNKSVEVIQFEEKFPKGTQLLQVEVVEIKSGVYLRGSLERDLMIIKRYSISPFSKIASKIGIITHRRTVLDNTIPERVIDNFYNLRFLDLEF